MNNKEVETQIKCILIEILEINLTPEDIDNKESLFGEKIFLDSISSISMVIEIEKHFNIKIPDEDIDYNFFRNISTITKYISNIIS